MYIFQRQIFFLKLPETDSFFQIFRTDFFQSSETFLFNLQRRGNDVEYHLFDKSFYVVLL